jgi:hypothetical protein
LTLLATVADDARTDQGGFAMKGSCLLLAALLSMAAPLAFAAPQDPARVDGSQAADPAAVFARPARAQRASLLPGTSAPRQDSTLGQLVQKSGLLSGDASHRIEPLSPERYRQAYGNADVRSRLGRTYAIGNPDRSGSGSWLQQLLSPQDRQAGQQDLTLQQGMRTAQDAMDEMGRQLMPALRDIKRDFDSGLDRASNAK